MGMMGEGEGAYRVACALKVRHVDGDEAVILLSHDEDSVIQ